MPLWSGQRLTGAFVHVRSWSITERGGITCGDGLVHVTAGVLRRPNVAVGLAGQDVVLQVAGSILSRSHCGQSVCGQLSRSKNYAPESVLAAAATERRVLAGEAIVTTTSSPWRGRPLGVAASTELGLASIPTVAGTALSVRSTAVAVERAEANVAGVSSTSAIRAGHTSRRRRECLCIGSSKGSYGTRQKGE